MILWIVLGVVVVVVAFVTWSALDCARRADEYAKQDYDELVEAHQLREEDS